MAALLPALPLADPATSNPSRLAGTLQARLLVAAGGSAALLAAIALIALLLPPAAALPWIAALALAGIATCVACAAWLLLRVARPMERALACAHRLQSGDLTGAIDAKGAGELAPMLTALREVQERLFTVVSQVRTGTTSVAGTSSQIQRDNDALDQRTSTQADSLQSTAASMEQLTAAVRHNAENAQLADALVGQASERATQGGELMGEVVATMAAMRESSHRIVDIIGVIDGIAFQTNILALNAAVEAARAGEQGRGFAVVASEVRNLAQRCAAAAKEVKELIAAAADGVDAGSRQVDAAGQAMTEIVDAVRQVAERIGQISVGSREQSDGIEAVNQAVARMEHTTQANASLVKMAARTSVTLNAQGVALLKSVAVFDLGEREHGNADEAAALVAEAAGFARSQGVQALVDDVNKLAAGRFIERDLYLMVIRAADSAFIAHGNNPRTLGLGRQSKDADGKAFVQEMVRVARDSRQGGWVDYKWAHPVTNEVLTKSSFVLLCGEVVLACGIYKR